MKKKILLIIIILLGTIGYLLYDRYSSEHYKYPLINIHSDKDIVNKNDLSIFEYDGNYSINEELLGKAKDGEYTKLFNKDVIQDVIIKINDNNFKYLLQHALDKRTVLIDEISIGEYHLKYCSIKPKGLTSLRRVYNTTSDRFSYTVNFKKYINKDNGYSKNQNLFGLSKISFNNMYADPTLMKEYLSYYLLTEMGLDTVDYSYTKLFINDNYYGLYLMIEPITKALINRYLNEDGDFLFKPEGDYASLIYDNSLDKYIDKNGNFNFNSILYDKKGELIYPNNANNPLNKYKGIWEDDREEFNEIVDELPLFFKTIKKLNELSNMSNKNTKYYEEELNKIIDVDKLIRYLAVDSYIVNSDGYMSPRGTNYALYMNDKGYITIIPWDYNLSFGGTLFSDIDEVINFDIYNPVAKTTLSKRPLINVILSNDKYKEKYLTYLEDATKIMTGGTTSSGKVYNESNYKGIIKTKGEELINYSSKSNMPFYSSKDMRIAQENLIKLIELRTESVINQINGIDSKIHSDIEIRTLGGF